MHLLIKTILAVSIFAFPQEKIEDLKNTTWSGTLHAPDAVEAVLEFKADSMFVYIGTDLIETMTYQVASDTLKLKKVGGNSPCGQELGSYRYSISNDQLKLVALQDDCEVRKGAFSPDGYKRMK